jgi:DNA-binding GntR family transcriptional regulator
MNHLYPAPPKNDTYTIEGKRLSDQVTDSLRDAIISGKLAAGERLLETDLADRYGVSRDSLRAALRQLDAEGLVITRPRKGTFVVELTETDLEEIYTLRLALETLAVERLVQSITADQIRQFELVIAEIDQAIAERNVSKVAHLEIKFHELIWRFSNHSRLYKIWVHVSQQLRMFVVAADPFFEPQENVPRHKQLLAAIASGNKEEAKRTLLEHINNGVRRLSLYGRLPSHAESQTLGNETQELSTP